MLKFIELDGALEKVELVCTKTDGTKYDFNSFFLSLKFIEKFYNYKITLDEAIEDQTKLKILINKLNNNYNPKNIKKVEEKKRVLEPARKLSVARDEIINLFKKGTFPYRGNVFKTKEKEESEEKSEELDEESDKELDENKFLNILRMNQKV